MMGRQEFDQRGPSHAALGVIQDAVHARKQLQTVEAACSPRGRIGNRKRLQPDGGQHLPSAMNRNFDAVGKRVEGHVNAFAIAAELGNRFSANVSRGPGKLRDRLRMKPRLGSLMLHGAAKHSHQVPILVQVKYDANWLVTHGVGPR